jgi:hypothetical protein
MKKSMMFILSLAIVSYCTVVSVHAQGKSAGHAPSIGQGHGQSGALTHGKSTSTPKSTTSTSSGHQSKPSWETQFSARIESDSAFKLRIENLLPANTDLLAAASGFKNRGQFIAALHVSNNLEISFDALKAKMTGVTTTAAGETIESEPMSLGKAIHELRPTIPVTVANEEAGKAEEQAETTETTNSTT